MSEGILFSQMQPPSELTEEFHRWYETDHIPARMVLPGFVSARRYAAVEGTPKYLAAYFLDDLAALKTPEYLRLKASPSALTGRMLGLVECFTRYTGELVSDVGDATADGDFLSVVGFEVPLEDTAEFERWYRDEHEPMLLEVEGWLRIRRYLVLDGEGGPWTHLALHELAAAEVMNSPARARARAAPLRSALAGRPWFATSGRWLYQAVSAHCANGTRPQSS
jgi:hypothetical protein